MTMNSLLYAVVVPELFPDMIILELFEKVWEVFVVTPKPHQPKTLEKAHKLQIFLFRHEFLLPYRQI